MKIIVNACPLLNLPTGIGRYLRSLYSEISLQHPEIEIKYFDGTGLYDEMPNPPQDKSFWAIAAKTAWKLPSFIPFLARILVHEKRARTFFKLSENFDIYHEAGYFPLKTAKKVKTVFTIHDISLKTLPDFHPKERVRFFDRYFARSMQHVDLIITPSEFTKREIKNEYPQIDVPIHSISLGFEKRLFSERSKDTIDLLKTKLNLPEKYILFVGTSDPRKNIKLILRAMRHLPESVKLVCAGWSGWHRMIRDSRIDADIKDRIVFAGYLKDQDLAALYSGARAFVYPSFYEGFGLPVLEAMGCGCPVVCSNRSSLPEVSGNAALYCDPDNPTQLASMIKKLLDSEALYAEMRLKGLAQAEKFSWTKTAGRTVKAFSETL